MGGCPEPLLRAIICNFFNLKELKENLKKIKIDKI